MVHVDQGQFRAMSKRPVAGDVAAQTMSSSSWYAQGKPMPRRSAIVKPCAVLRKPSSLIRPMPRRCSIRLCAFFT